jgi:hypothetical protein
MNIGKERALLGSLFFSGSIGFFVRALDCGLADYDTSYVVTRGICLAYQSRNSKYEVFRPLHLPLSAESIGSLGSSRFALWWRGDTVYRLSSPVNAIPLI